MFRRNLFLTGFVPALFLPLVGSLLFYFLFFGHMQILFFMKHILATNKWISVLSLGVIMNLGLFMWYIRKGHDQSARGVLGATFIFAFIVVIVKTI